MSSIPIKSRTERIRRGVIHTTDNTETYKNIVPMSALINRTKGVSFTTNKYKKIVRAIVPLIGEVLLAPCEMTVILPTHTAKQIKIKNINRAKILEACSKAKRG